VLKNKKLIGTTISRKSLSHQTISFTKKAKPNKNLKLFLKHLVFPGARCFTFGRQFGALPIGSPLAARQDR
jgi:hypothetical protein